MREGRCLGPMINGKGEIVYMGWGDRIACAICHCPCYPKNSGRSAQLSGQLLSGLADASLAGDLWRVAGEGGHRPNQQDNLIL